MPEGPTVPGLQNRAQSSLHHRVARAFRRRKLLETGAYAAIDEMAAAERINASYVCRVLRLTLLAPDIVDAVLDGRQPRAMTLAGLMKPFAVGWGEQRHGWAFYLSAYPGRPSAT